MDDVRPRRVLTNEEISILLLGGYDMKTGKLTDGLVGDLRDVKRDQRITGSILATLLLPVAAEAIKHLFGL